MNKMKSFISQVVNTLCEKTKNLFTEDIKKNDEEHQILNEPIEETDIPDVVQPQEENTSESQEKIVRLLTVSEAAKLNKVTRQAIFFAIKMERLPAKKEGDTWLISSQDLKEYNKTRYCRKKSKREGELIFDKDKGFFSIAEVAKILRKNTNQVYYLVRMGRIKTHRQGSAIVIKESDLQEFLDIEQKNSKRKTAV